MYCTYYTISIQTINTRTPPCSQLFRKPHPQRAPPPAPASLPLFNAPDAFRRMAVILPAHQRANVPLVAMRFAGSQLVGVTADHQIASYRWQSADATSFTFASLTDAPYTLEHDSTPLRPMGTHRPCNLRMCSCM